MELMDRSRAILGDEAGTGDGDRDTVDADSESIEESDPESVVDGAGPVPERDIKILLVEDNRVSLVALCDLLQDEGFEIMSAQTGAEARVRAESGFDLLITDLGLPDVDGRELAAELCRDGRDTPIIYLSGRPLSEAALGQDRSRAKFLQKPIDFDELLATISASLASDHSG